jgi:hypothetical protein
MAADRAIVREPAYRKGFAMSDPEIVEAIEKVKALCDAYYADGYQPVSMRSGLTASGYDREQIREVLAYVAARGFEYCLDYTIECSSGTTDKPRSRPDQQVCWWGPDQLKSRLDCLSSRPYPAA